MKKDLLVLGLLLAITAQTQDLLISPTFENINVGPKIGLSIGYQLQNKLTLAGFYLKPQPVGSSAEQPFTKNEKTFYGASVGLPINESFDFTMRFGFSDNQKIMVAPAVWGYLALMKNLDWGLAVGMRDFHPSMQTSLRLTIPTRTIN